ncbi:hypothetical protein EPN52_14010 [bacterium]|nr:MAG: hypothetical protein EPN52_14010 [bacterium]
MISYVLCILAGFVLPGIPSSAHLPWLQFFPGFVWLSWGSFFLGLAESVVYGWYTAVVFVPLWNYFHGVPK